MQTFNVLYVVSMGRPPDFYLDTLHAICTRNKNFKGLCYVTSQLEFEAHYDRKISVVQKYKRQ